jgi:hypothetical protein
MSRYYRTLLATLTDAGSDFLTNLVAYYAFQNNVNDSLGVHNGTAIGSPTYTTGINGQGIDFGNDATLRYVDVADSDDFSFTDGTNDLPFSISLWVNFSSFSSTGNWLINKRQNTTGLQEWQLYRDSSNNRIILGLASQSDYNSNRIEIQSNAFTTTGAWTHIAVTYNGSSNQSGLNLYINGSLNINNRSQLGTYVRMNNTTSILRLAQAGFSINTALKHRGLLDEIAIWKNRELTSTEVTELYNAGTGKFYPF